MKIARSHCKRKLAIMWLSVSAFLFIMLIIQTIFGKYGVKDSEAWAWLLQTIMPSLSLIMSVFVIDAISDNDDEKLVDSFFYRLSYTLSFTYLALVVFTILAQPFAFTFGNMSALEMMKKSGLWLGPLQGLVGGALAMFFIKSERK